MVFPSDQRIHRASGSGTSRETPHGVSTRTTPVYNSQIFHIYVRYMESHHPDVNIDDLLSQAGMTRFEIEDPAHWFNQHQANRFHAELKRLIPGADLPRQVGRFTVESDSMSAIKRYLIGMVSPAIAYQLIGRYSKIVSRATTVQARSESSHSAELTFTPLPGVQEQRGQCENRKGLLESIGKILTGRYAQLNHPECVHQGDTQCRYLVSWEFSPSFRFRLWAKRLLLAVAVSPIAWLFSPLWLSVIVTVLPAVAACMTGAVAIVLEARELKLLLRQQGHSASTEIEEVTLRYNAALLAQEIGQITTQILSSRETARQVMTTVRKRLDIRKGALFLTTTDGDGFELAYGYGLPDAERGSESFLEMGGFDTIEAPLPESPEGKSTLLRPDDPFCRRLSERLDMASPLLFPIAHDREILGLLVLDVGSPSRTVSQSDLNVLTAVSTQLGVTIRNIRYMEELKTREAQLRMVTDNVDDIIWQLNPLDRTFEYVSPSIEPVLGYRPEEVIGTAISGYFSDESLALITDILGRRSKDDNDKNIPTPIEVELIQKNGAPLWAEVNFGTIRSRRGPGPRYLGIARDITERKKADAERQRLEERLQRAERMEAIGTLAGGVAHDLNNVLSGIVGYPEMLLLELPPSSPLREPIETIMASGNKAAAIVQDLLTLARRGVVTRQQVNLNQVIQDYLESPQFQKLISFHDRVVVETNLTEPLPDISGSPFHLFKVLMNLVSNAAEAMPEGGKIVIATNTHHGNVPVDRGDRQIGREWVVVKVVDNGIGIATADLKRIFEPFYTKKVMGRSGTGLGMAVVWGTVKDHNGHIDVRSKENEYTEFTLFLPSEKSSTSDAQKKSAPTNSQGSGEMILVVDDLKDQLVLAEKMLTLLGYEVHTAGSGEEAIEFVRSHAPDLLVLDMLMEPGIDGLETYRRILTDRPGQKAMIASGYAASDRVQEALKLGAGGYIRKPYRLETLGTAVKKALSAPGPVA